MKLTLKVWRQKNAKDKGRFVSYGLPDVSVHMSFSRCLTSSTKADRERRGAHCLRPRLPRGICGTCSMVVNGIPHGPQKETTTCQCHMRNFKDGDVITIEPWRARAFPVIKDLVVDRSALDRIIQAGGFISVGTGSAPDGNAIPVPKDAAELAMDAAACIGCGACVAACPNASAMLFVAAKVSHLGLLPQGQPERQRRVRAMVAQMDAEGFGACSNHGECAAVCPKGIDLSFIARLNRDLVSATILG